MLIRVTAEQRLFVDVEGPQLVPDGAGMREKPTLILLHGGPGFDHSSFKPLFSQLSDVAQIVYVDHRGHGRSDRCPPEQWTLDTFADDIVRLCDVLGIVKPIVLGQSFGGFVAQRYLARHPAHPSKVILSSTSHHGDLARKLAMFEKLGGVAARESAAAFWSQPDAQTWKHYRDVCLSLYNQKFPADPLAAGRTVFNEAILFAFVGGEKKTMDLLPGLKAVQCPVLVMAGRMDPVCPLADAEEIAAAIPAPWGRLAVFEKSGHGAWRDEPEAAMAVLRGFIDEST
jgi:proline iminopeptidase